MKKKDAEQSLVVFVLMNSMEIIINFYSKLNASIVL